MANARSSPLVLAWAKVRDSLWLVPSCAVLIGGTLAFVAVQIPAPDTQSRFVWVWISGSGAEGARGVLSVIAGSLITVTGTVFSVTIVALQLASSQFTPRLLRSFLADRVNQVVLGVFIGTFTYTLLILRTIHSETDVDAFVPQVGVSVALLLLLLSIAALIVFINHSARSIQASVILHRETERTLGLIRELYPKNVGTRAAPSNVAGNIEAATPSGPRATVLAEASGYLEAVHDEGLWRLAAQQRGERLTIRMELHVGEFAFTNKVIASVWPAEAATDAVVREIRRAFVIGPERTPEQDVEYGIVELSDIGVRALSPGINDPTTAMHCVDRLTQVLAALGSRPPGRVSRSSPDGTVTLLVRETPFERAAGLALDQIRHYGASNPAIVKKLLDAVIDLAPAVKEDNRPVLRAHAEAALAAARRLIADPIAAAEIERLAVHAIAATEGDELPNGESDATTITR